ncbi:MAG: hypothetical protein IPN88_10475 [Bacteroidetes bacterium]|nr:hypothetical protein [Bacteroidota bacterium]
MIAKNNLQVPAGRINEITVSLNNLIVDISLRGGNKIQTLKSSTNYQLQDH